MDLKIVLGGLLHTNCYLLIESDSVIIIDYAPEVNEFIKKRGLKPAKLLITHIHFDHIAGLEDFIEEYPDVEVYISKEGKDNINKRECTLNFEMPYSINSSNFIEAGNDTVIKFGEEEITVLKTPGHSADSVVYYIKSLKSLFCGDVIFFKSVGRTDFPGSSHSVLMDSIEEIFKKYDDETLLYPGHGPKTSVGFEKRHNSFIKSFT